MCKVEVTGRNCDRCKDGYYGLHKTNVYGCVGELFYSFKLLFWLGESFSMKNNL